MYLSKITLRPDAFDPARLGRVAGAGEYRMHQLVWQLFADHADRARDFLYRREETRGLPLFYTVSARPPCDGEGVWEIQEKPYDPRLRGGDRLAFSVRVNPIVSKRDEHGRQHRHDVVMEAKCSLEREGLAREQWPSQGQLVYAQGIEWLRTRAERGGFGFDPDEVRVEGYTQHRLHKPGKEKPIHLSTLEFTGLLEVDDPERFRELLFTGIGPAKGFGCGLMMVRRV